MFVCINRLLCISCISRNVLVSLDNKIGRYLPDFVDSVLDWDRARGQEIQHDGDVLEGARELGWVLLSVVMVGEWFGRCALGKKYNALERSAIFYYILVIIIITYNNK